MSSILVIGGGWTGAIVARELALGAKLPVSVLEAGPRARSRLPQAWSKFEQSTEALTKVDRDVWAYDVRGVRRGGASSSFEWLRVRAVGGRTLLWGAWMDRPTPACLPGPWTSKKLHTLVRNAERWLGVQTARSVPDRVVKSLSARPFRLHVEPKRACLAAGGQRPLTALDLLLDQQKAKVRPNTVVVRVLSDRSRVRGVEAVDLETRRTFMVDADVVVLAASPFETIRILKESGLDQENTALGAGWSDHLVAGSIVLVEEEKSVSRSPAAGPLDGNAALIRMPARKLALRSSMEVRGPTPLASLDPESLRAMGFEDPRDARRFSYFAVFALGEMAVRSERRMMLDPKLRDALGRPRIRLVVPSLSSDERALARQMDTDCAEICEALSKQGPSGRPSSSSRARVFKLRSARQQGDSGHEAGGCPTGTMVDEDGAVEGTRGLYVADAARMGRALDIHPSLTLAALALGTAERIKKDLSRR